MHYKLIALSIHVKKFAPHCHDSSVTPSGRQTLDNASATGILVPGVYITVMSNHKHLLKTCCFSWSSFLRVNCWILWSHGVPLGSIRASVVQIWLRGTISPSLSLSLDRSIDRCWITVFLHPLLIFNIWWEFFLCHILRAGSLFWCPSQKNTPCCAAGVESCLLLFYFSSVLALYSC